MTQLWLLLAGDLSLLWDSGMAVWRPVVQDGAELPPVQRGERPAYLLTGPSPTPSLCRGKCNSR